jgi:hypothetical protein
MNNRWLYEQLSGFRNIDMSDDYRPLIIVTKGDREFKIYAPDPKEYLITVDVVEKVMELGGNIISFPTSWCRASQESIAFARSKGIQIMPHGSLFEMLQT